MSIWALTLFNQSRPSREGQLPFGHKSYFPRLWVSLIATTLALAPAIGCGGGATVDKIPLAAKPTFSPAAGTYSSPQMVTISDITPGVTIYYTTDGTIPTTSSAVYSGPIRVATNETVEALAVEPGEISSALSSANYDIALVNIGAPETQYCIGPNHILPAGDVNTDLDINGNACTVDGSAPQGTYIYRNVNIRGGGSLTFADAKIDFHAHSILVENHGSLYAGLNAPAVGPINIWLYGAAQDGIPAITCKSGPTCGVPEAVWNSNPNVPMKTMPNKWQCYACAPGSGYQSRERSSRYRRVGPLTKR